MTQNIMMIPGVGESTKKALAKEGIRTVSDLAKSSVEQLLAVKGFGEVRAARAIAAAASLQSCKPRVKAAAKKGLAKATKATKVEENKKKKKDKKKEGKKDKKKKNKKKSKKSKKGKK
jgi:transcription termination factor NusA